MSLAFDDAALKVETPKLPDSRDLDERPWLARYMDCVPPNLDYPQEPVYWLLERAAANYPDRTAVRYYEQTFTYRELLTEARRCAALLQQHGLKPGDRVGLLLPNVPEWLIAAYGIWMAGGVVVSLSPLLVREEVSDLIAATECRMVIALDVLVPLAYDGEHHAEEVFTVTLQDRLPRWQRIGYAFVKMKKLGLRPYTGEIPLRSFVEELRKVEPIAEPIRPPLDSPAFILPTGGTTGHPKAVTLSHRNLLSNAWQLMHWGTMRTGKETMLAVIPFFHSYGLSTCATTGTALAATLVLHHRFQPTAILRLIERHEPTVFPAVPAMLHILNQHLREKQYQVRSIHWCISGGASLSREIAEEFADHTGAIVVEGYGLSEASPVTHVGLLDGSNRPGTIGLPLPDTYARIVDAETGTRELPPGEVGELIVRGPQVMLGYWKDPEATAKAIRDGWLYTGDLATRDEAGFFRIVDRKKDLIITSGFNVYPADVESVLRKFPGVEDAAVVGVPDEQRGQIVKAILSMKKGAHFDRKAFDHYTEEHLGRHKRPKLVEVLEGDLPRNFLGKVLRRKLRES